MAISFDFNKTMAQAKTLDQLATDMQNNTCRKMTEISDNIGAAWTGRAATAYRNYVKAACEDLSKKANYMRNTAEFLRNAAKKLKEADEAAKNASKNI
ncbi:MAG: WXG100 family type VII secretion target [Deltaproteobacteria bacterium]|jgi:uncharacterized protein YukE|nr:WXG100 family type VII secretion target [Deltaproteobacteria bacterium]